MSTAKKGRDVKHAKKLLEASEQQMLKGYGKSAQAGGKLPKVYDSDKGVVYPDSDDAGLGDYEP